MSDRQESSGWWLASDGKWYPPESHPSAVAGTAPPAGIGYAGFWLRVWAAIIHSIIVSVAVAILANALNIEGGGLFSSDPSQQRSQRRGDSREPGCYAAVQRLDGEFYLSGDGRQDGAENQGNGSSR